MCLSVGYSLGRLALAATDCRVTFLDGRFEDRPGRKFCDTRGGYVAATGQAAMCEAGLAMLADAPADAPPPLLVAQLARLAREHPPEPAPPGWEARWVDPLHSDFLVARVGDSAPVALRLTPQGWEASRIFARWPPLEEETRAPLHREFVRRVRAGRTVVEHLRLVGRLFERVSSATSYVSPEVEVGVLVAHNGGTVTSRLYVEADRLSAASDHELLNLLRKGAGNG